jgi:hypothetical protein
MSAERKSYSTLQELSPGKMGELEENGRAAVFKKVPTRYIVREGV